MATIILSNTNSVWSGDGGGGITCITFSMKWPLPIITPILLIAVKTVISITVNLKRKNHTHLAWNDHCPSSHMNLFAVTCKTVISSTVNLKGKNHIMSELVNQYDPLHVHHIIHFSILVISKLVISKLCNSLIDGLVLNRDNFTWAGYESMTSGSTFQRSTEHSIPLLAVFLFCQ